MTAISSNDDRLPRPPISAALLAQADNIEPDTCIGYDEAQHIMGGTMPSETGQSVVTWRGRDAVTQLRQEKLSC
jgi:hypothetical protein